MALTDNMHPLDAGVAAIQAAQGVQPPAPAPVHAPSIGASSLSTAYTDPSILAFLRTSGHAQEVAAADVARRRAGIEAALGTNLDDLSAQGQIARRNIQGNQEARGVFRSGQTQTLTAEEQAAQARQQGSLRGQAAAQIGDLTNSLTQQIAGNQQKASEYALTRSQANDVMSGKAGIDATYGTTGGNDPYAGDSGDSYSG